MADTTPTKTAAKKTPAKSAKGATAKASGPAKAPARKTGATKRGEDLGLSDDEVAFYDALAANESAVRAMGDAQLRVIAAELITQVRKSVTIDWTLREGARAKIRVMVKRILNKYGYPPDLQDDAVKTVLLQAELLCADWAEGGVGG